LAKKTENSIAGAGRAYFNRRSKKDECGHSIFITVGRVYA